MKFAYCAKGCKKKKIPFQFENDSDSFAADEILRRFAGDWRYAASAWTQTQIAFTNIKRRVEAAFLLKCFRFIR